MYQPVHEHLARARHVERQAQADHAGIRRSARLISLHIRRQRQAGHACLPHRPPRLT